MSQVVSPGLREAKKRQARETIRTSAYSLFAAQGYRDTTMEQIAAAAGVAPRTVYRYFPTKDTLVVTDEDDERMLERFRTELAEHAPLDALQRTFQSVLVGGDEPVDRLRRSLIASEPELQASMLRFVIGLADHFAQTIVEQSGRPQDANEARALTGAVAGISLVIFRWDTTESQAEQIQGLNVALDRLARGFSDRGTPRA